MIKKIRNKKTILAFIGVGTLLILLAGAIWIYVGQKTFKETKDDVLIAQDCGMDGLQCCSSEPKCSFGQECCVNPNNQKQNQCADQCGCGQQDQFCCADNQCDQGMACVDAKCTACGGENQPCCGDICTGNSKSGNSLVCFADQCVGCGEIGYPCCGESKCFGADQPEKTLAECAGGICNACGGNQLGACAGQPRCLTDFLLNNNTCFKCGEINEPCCADKKCNSKANLKCLQGFCQ